MSLLVSGMMVTDEGRFERHGVCRVTSHVFDANSLNCAHIEGFWGLQAFAERRRDLDGPFPRMGCTWVQETASVYAFKISLVFQ